VVLKHQPGSQDQHSLDKHFLEQVLHLAQPGGWESGRLGFRDRRGHSQQCGLQPAFLCISSLKIGTITVLSSWVCRESRMQTVHG
jgi:hypothetical protein